MPASKNSMIPRRNFELKLSFIYRAAFKVARKFGANCSKFQRSTEQQQSIKCFKIHSKDLLQNNDFHITSSIFLLSSVLVFYFFLILFFNSIVYRFFIARIFGVLPEYFRDWGGCRPPRPPGSYAYGDTISSSQTIICGIPQGSTLGPLLFLLYINDLPNCSSKLSFRIFADDTNMFYTSNNLRNLESVMNEEFKLVVKYCATNKLSINLSKTNYILVSSSRLNGSINVNDIKIQSQIKYLGAYIDQHLNWGPQIEHINNKLAKNIGIITKLRHYVNLHTLKQLYYSFIYPYLTYAITSWGSACKTRLNKIGTKQNKCIRSIFFAHSRENATPYYNLTGYPKT